MADYNYHRPDIVGMEWVPIKDAAYQPDPTIERGYTFSVPVTGGAIVPRRGLYYVEDPPVGVTITQVPLVSVYTKDSLTYGQAVTTTTVPCEFASSTGDGSFNGGTGSDTLENPSDNEYYQFGSSPPDSGTLTLRFDVPTIVGTVLNVSLVYAASGDLARLGTSPNLLLMGISKASANTVLYGTGILEGGTAFFGDDTVRHGRVSFGNIDPHGPFTSGNAFSTNERIPWNSDNLALFNNGASPQYSVFITWNNTTALTSKLHYAALEITSSALAEPVLTGGLAVGLDNVGLANSYSPGANYVNLFGDAFPAVTGTALKPADYVVTFRLGDTGDMRTNAFLAPALTASNSRPVINALRELYQEPPIRGVRIDRPKTINENPKIETSPIIPTVGITTTGAPTTMYAECHGYKTQSRYVNFSVLSSIFQEFRSVNQYGALPYPWFRFYARRRDGIECTGLTVLGPDSATASISGEELDALPEIVDGWREVTVRFEGTSPVPVMDNSFTLESFSITYEPSTLGNVIQEVGIEVLGATSDSILLPANYQPGTNLLSSDIVFLFSTDPPTVTGLAVTPASFPVTGIGMDCTTAPACIPTEVPYNRVTWAIPNFQTEIFDSFDRTLASSWGNANTGQLWTNSGGAASDYSVATSDGIHTITTTNVARHSTIGPTTLRDFDVTTTVLMPTSVEVSGAPWSNSVLGRFTDVSNNYRFQAEITTDETVFTVSIIRRSGGSDTVLATGTVDMYPTFGAAATFTNNVTIRATAQGPLLRMKMWNADDQDEPNTWQLTALDSTFTAGQVGVRTIANTGNTNIPLTFRYHMFWTSPLLDNFGYYELQRRDDYEDWQTILTATSPGVTGFADVEARIGVRSDYRIREVNVHDFTGPWSVTVTGTAVNPAISLGGDPSRFQILVFSSNTDQTGARALAYGEVWENNPSNEMTYFEGNGMLQFQRMFGRDYQVGFHTLERGGVQFTVALLVQNAAVAAPVLEDAFLSLRDLAWASMPYVCVRTSNGDRWFAAVEVPSGTIGRKRRLQLVQVRITQVTDTPYPADPPLWFDETLRGELPCRAQVVDF